MRSLDLNDTDLGTEPLHPSEVLPTALGLFENEAASGRTLIEAIVSGYESNARITDPLSFIERGFHPLCAMSYAIPLMAGRVWRLPIEAVTHAVGLSAARGYTSFVVNSGETSMMQAMGLAATAADGIFLTRLAAQGFTGTAETLKWFAAKVKPSNADLSVDLDHARYRLPRLASKRFHIQIELVAVAEAGSILAPQVAGRAQDIQKIVVQTYPGIIDRMADPAKFRPTSKGTADHSLPVCLAMALLDGDVTVKQFDDHRWRDREVMSVVALSVGFRTQFHFSTVFKRLAGAPQPAGSAANAPHERGPRGRARVSGWTEWPPHSSLAGQVSIDIRHRRRAR